jgi:hypothetical protein
LDLITGSKNDAASVTLWHAPPQARQLDQWRPQPLRPAGWIMSLVAQDMDRDGDADLLLSDRRGAARGVFWLENPGADAVRSAQPWPSHYVGGRDAEVMFVGSADLDRDGTTEWVVPTVDARLLIFRSLDRQPDSWESWTVDLPDGHRRGKAVASGDIDGDDQQDLVVTTEDGCVAWLTWKGAFRQADWTWHQINGDDGYKFDRVELLDLDQDGDLDILTCEERHNLGVVWFENPR